MSDSQAQPKPLTRKQEAFVLAYIGEARWNATEAARIAGYKKPNPEGSRLLAKASIAARVSEALEERKLSADQVLILLREDAIRNEDDILCLAKRAADTAGVPAGASTVSALMSARTTARTNLAKAHGLLTEKHEIDANIEIPVFHILRDEN